MTITLTRGEAQNVLNLLIVWLDEQEEPDTETAIEILRAKLSEPEPEPVAWMDAPERIYLQVCDDENCDLSFEAHDDVSWCQDKINDCDILYVRSDTAQPQREWQGLTDEEYEAMAEQYVTNCYFDTLKFARAIEAKLRELNLC
jgi:hypothetical protein